MGDGTEFDIADEIGQFKCPKCGSDMVELMQEGMTEGQRMDYDAGFNHPYECSECGYTDLYDVDMPDMEPDDIDYDSFEVEEEQEQEIPILIDEEATNATITGIILRETIEIEQEINMRIANHFVPDDEKRKQFHNDVLQKEFFSFEQKINLFKKIRNKGNDELIKKIRFIQAIRNAIAHTKGIFDKKQRHYTITYKENGKEEKLNLNKEFIQTFQQDCFTIKGLIRS